MDGYIQIRVQETDFVAKTPQCRIIVTVWGVISLTVGNREGLHARPVMQFVDLASKFRSQILVANVSGRGEKVDGKSAMQMMLLEAIQGNVVRIEACGEDAQVAVDALADLVSSGFKHGSSHSPNAPSGGD